MYKIKSIVGFIANPSIQVVADIIVRGIPNHSDFTSSITNRLNQSASQLLEGSLMAVESVTEVIEHTVDVDKDNLQEERYSKIDTNEAKLKDLLTDKCYNRLVDCYPVILTAKKEIHLINTPREDIFFAWIQQLKSKLKQL